MTSFSSSGTSMKNMNPEPDYTGDPESSYGLLAEEPPAALARATDNEGACFGRCIKAPCGRGLHTYTWKNSYDRWICWLSSLTVFFLLIGVIFPLIMNKIVNDGVNDEVIIDSKDATSYDAWQSNFYGKGDKVDIRYDVYIFDVQNPTDVINGSKPIVVEVGPYSFNEYYNKFNIKFFDGGNKVQYNDQRFYVFNQEASGQGLSLNDKLTIPYVTTIGFQYLLSTIPESSQIALDIYMEEQIHAKVMQIETAIQAKEDEINAMPIPQEQKDALIAELEVIRQDLLIIEEYIDAFLNETDIGTTITKLVLCEASPNGLMPFWTTDPVSAYFGWLNDPVLVAMQNLLNATNNTDVAWTTSVAGVSTNYTSEHDAQRRKSPTIMYTGKNDVKQNAEFIRYNNMTTQYVCVDPMASCDPDSYTEGEEFPACAHFQHEWTREEAEAKGYRLAFNSPYANRIAGTDASMFGRPVTSEKLLVYISDIYRTAFLGLKDIVYDWHGIQLRRYGLQMKDLQNATMNPEAAQYYNYAPSGMENLTAATGVPAWASKPHFLDADTSLQAAVWGMSPKRLVHDTYLDVEPNTGMLARAYKRLQLNYYMEDYHLPTVSEEAVTMIEGVCAALNNGTECYGLDAMLSCLAIPTDWKYQNGGVYFPYAWVEESLVMDEDTANGIKDGIYGAQELGEMVQLWSFVAAGILAAVIGGLVLSKYLQTRAKGKSFVSMSASENQNLMWGSERQPAKVDDKRLYA